MVDQFYSNVSEKKLLYTTNLFFFFKENDRLKEVCLFVLIEVLWSSQPISACHARGALPNHFLLGRFSPLSN